MIPKLLCEKEAAEALRVKPQTLAAWRCRGTVTLPFVKVGRLVMYREEDVIRFIEENLQGGDHAAH